MRHRPVTLLRSGVVFSMDGLVTRLRGFQGHQAHSCQVSDLSLRPGRSAALVVVLRVALRQQHRAAAVGVDHALAA
jgi:hypothetical protein